MAQGKTQSIKKFDNNKTSTPISAVAELVVVNDQLVPDQNSIHPGVNSASNKN